MELIFGFFIGFISDLIRSVFLPASTDWINRLIPSARQKKNLDENILMLDIMEKLKLLGKDPELARHAREDAAKFMSVLNKQKEAFVENAIEVMEVVRVTQTEMNIEAERRADVARMQMGRSIIALESSGCVNEEQAAALSETQALWEKYAQSQAGFAAIQFKGGSMSPLVFASELESITVSRAGELKRMLQEMRERFVE